MDIQRDWRKDIGLKLNSPHDYFKLKNKRKALVVLIVITKWLSTSISSKFIFIKFTEKLVHDFNVHFQLVNIIA